MNYLVRGLLLTIGVFSMLIHSGCSGMKYERYVSNDPEFDVIVDYIAGWGHSEQKGSYDSFTQVVFTGPRNKIKGPVAIMVVTVEKSGKVSFSPLNVEGLAEDLVNKRLKHKDAQLISKTEAHIAGIEAKDILLSYRTLDKIDALDAKLVPMKESAVVFQKGDKFYTLRYVSMEKNFPVFEKAFSHMVDSLKFR